VLATASDLPDPVAQMAADTAIDWSTLAQLPEVVGLAGAITSRWNVWVGLVTPAGTALPVRGRYLASEGARLPLCESFKRRTDERGSCEASLRGWAQRRDQGHVACHAGLSAVVVPVEVPRLGRAALYASGFIAPETGLGGLAPLLERAAVLGLPRAAVAADLERAPRHDAAARAEIEGLLESMRDAIAVAAQGAGVPASRGYDYSPIIGRSPRVLKLFAMLDKVVQSESTILIHGENGTGKELFARAIHANSRRGGRAFVTQNCAALNDNLLESELFGHKRGAFTGAVADKRGLFELADGGTLFLDEVGDMSPTMQVKLLRVLQERAFMPVGDTVTHRVDVRVIAASNRDLRDLVREGTFREDLFYRLNVISLHVPALRERREDIPLLVEHFVGDYARRTGTRPKRLSDEAQRHLLAWDWPGNVRELRHEIERLFVLSGEVEVVEASLISPRIREGTDPEAAPSFSTGPTTLPEAVEALERRMILAALAETGWNKTRAADRLGISRRNLIRKVQAWRLESVGVLTEGECEGE
jgi:two-component system, NtrC family, response regulator HupR/HoxA